MSDLFWEFIIEVLLFPAAGSKRLWLPLRLFCILLILLLFGGVMVLLWIAGIAMLSSEPVKGFLLLLLAFGITLAFLLMLREKLTHPKR